MIHWAYFFSRKLLWLSSHSTCLQFPGTTCWWFMLIRERTLAIFLQNTCWDSRMNMGQCWRSVPKTLVRWPSQSLDKISFLLWKKWCVLIGGFVGAFIFQPIWDELTICSHFLIVQAPPPRWAQSLFLTELVSKTTVRATHATYMESGATRPPDFGLTHLCLDEELFSRVEFGTTVTTDKKLCYNIRFQQTQNRPKLKTSQTWPTRGLFILRRIEILREQPEHRAASAPGWRDLSAETSRRPRSSPRQEAT